MKMVNNLIEPFDKNLSSGLLIWTWIIFFIQVMMVTFKYCQMNTSEYWLKNLEIVSIVLMY